MRRSKGEELLRRKVPSSCTDNYKYMQQRAKKERMDGWPIVSLRPSNIPFLSFLLSLL